MFCPCAAGETFRAAVRADVHRAVVHLGGGDLDRRVTVLSTLRALFIFPGLTGVILYRFSHLLVTRLPTRLASLGWLPTRLAAVLVGVEIDPTTHCGNGLFINHFGPVVVGASGIGENCNLSHGVTIGSSATSEDDRDGDAPTIGDRVWVGPGAVVVGPLAVGNDAVVGANSVVTRSVPPAGVAVGNPARVLLRTGSFRQVRYAGMHRDPRRLTAMADAGLATDSPKAAVDGSPPEAPAPNGDQAST